MDKTLCSKGQPSIGEKFNRNDQIIKFEKSFEKVFHRLQEVDHSEYTFGTRTKLTYGEIHLLSAIWRSEGTYVTELAERFDVTKGAISQILNRLNRKKMIYKKLDPDNLSRKLVYTSEMGARACKGHQRFHEKQREIYERVFDKSEVEDIRKFNDVLKRLSDIVESGEFEALVESADEE